MSSTFVYEAKTSTDRRVVDWSIGLADGYQRKWSPVGCRSSEKQGKFASQRPTFYHCSKQRTKLEYQRGANPHMPTANMHQSPRLWNQLPDRQLCLDSPHHSLLVSSSLSSSPLSSSVTPSLQAQNLQQILRTLIGRLLPLDCLHDHRTGPDRTYHASRFIASF